MMIVNNALNTFGSAVKAEAKRIEEEKRKMNMEELKEMIKDLTNIVKSNNSEVDNLKNKIEVVENSINSTSSEIEKLKKEIELLKKSKKSKEEVKKEEIQKEVKKEEIKKEVKKEGMELNSIGVINEKHININPGYIQKLLCNDAILSFFNNRYGYDYTVVDIQTMSSNDIVNLINSIAFYNSRLGIAKKELDKEGEDIQKEINYIVNNIALQISRFNENPNCEADIVNIIDTYVNNYNALIPICINLNTVLMNIENPILANEVYEEEF